MSLRIFNTVTCCLLLAALYSCAEARRILCGSALADALEQACSAGYRQGKRADHFSGTIYNNASKAAPPTNGLAPVEGKQRSYNVPSLTKLDRLLTAAELKAMETLAELEEIRLTTLKKTSGDSDTEVDHGLHLRFRRQTQRRVTIVDECCRRPCSLQTLMSYCPADSAPVTDESLAQLGHQLGFTTPGTIAPRPQVATTTPEVSPTYRPAQIVRGRTRGRNATFFYVTFGDQATRSPLITELFNLECYGEGKLGRRMSAAMRSLIPMCYRLRESIPAEKYVVPYGEVMGYENVRMKILVHTLTPMALSCIVIFNFVFGFTISL